MSNNEAPVFQDAITMWWRSKKKNENEIERSQGGTRDASLRGDTMDGFRDAILQILEEEGVSKSDIYYGNPQAKLASNLPGFFRTSKNWDVVVCKNANHKRKDNPSLPPPTLIAAIEFKSQDKSIGNNQNNRIEESIGNAHDFWTAYEHRVLGQLIPRPWLGYLFVGKYAEGEEVKSVKVNQPLITTDPSFLPGDAKKEKQKLPGLSYAARYRVFLERMIAKKLYDSACFLVTSEDIAAETPNYRSIYSQVSDETFCDSLKRYIRAYYPDE